MRYVRDEHERGIAVGVSPTYTGCPATEVIQASIKARLQQAGFEACASIPCSRRRGPATG